MTSRDFCFWLQGAFELKAAKGEGAALTEAEAKSVQAHLALVFKHEIDPAMGPPTHQAALNEIHKPLAPSSSLGDFVMRC